MKTRLATLTALALLVLVAPRPAMAGCHFWSFADINIDQDKDITGTSVGSSLLTPTNVFGTCEEFGYGPGCGTDAVDDNYVYGFGNGMIKMIIPASGGHDFPMVLGTQGGTAGGGNEIRDFSVAREACIWFGDGCTRTIGH